jgi:O-antigen ligase
VNNASTYYSSKHFSILSGIFLICLAIAMYTSFYWIIAAPFFFLFFYFGWQQWSFIFLLLIFLLPWSIEYNFTPTLGTDLPDEPLMLVTAALFLANWFYNPSILSRSVWRHPLVSLLLLHFIWITIATIVSSDPIISLKFLLAKSWYLLAFVFTPLVLFKEKKYIRLAGVLFLVAMVLVTILSLYRHYKLGFSFANINNAVIPFFRNHVNYSAMLVCTVPVLVAAWQLNKKCRQIVFAALMIVLGALFFSYARGAWLALLIGVAAYVLISIRKLFFVFVVSVMLILLSVFWLKSNDRYLEYSHNFRTTIFHKDFSQHWAATYQLKDVSTAERFNRWIAGVRMIGDNWALGYGPNTFYYNYKPYAVPVFKTWVSKNEEHSTVHNYFLLTAIEQGLPGLLIFLLLVGAMIFYAERLYHRVADIFYKTTAMACGVMLMMILTVNFLSDLIETDKVGSLFFLCLAALVAVDVNSKKVRI